MDPLFLSSDEVLEIHEQQIERYRGSAGLRDPGGLESAIATPQATFGGEFFIFARITRSSTATREGGERRDHVPFDERLGAGVR